jgi:hypothetical protein
MKDVDRLVKGAKNARPASDAALTNTAKSAPR